VLDGKIMPELPAKLYAEGKQAHVPLMVGANSLDIGPMQGDQQMGEPARYVARQLAAQAARAMHAYWVALAKSGAPKVAGQPEWPTYNPQLDVIMDFTNAGPVVGPDPWRARLDLAERFNEAHAAVPR
jgi:carboxylesterase type B